MARSARSIHRASGRVEPGQGAPQAPRLAAELQGYEVGEDRGQAPLAGGRQAGAGTACVPRGERRI
ncbi:hypothetical protein AJ66_06261, partial [Pseudomonas aeruginosa 3579]